jgi:hypothetical protein
MNKSNALLWLFLAALILIVVGGGVLIYLLTTKFTPDPEIIMGIMIVFSIAALMTVLYLLAAGFSSMQLTDPTQALGLPEGSIRAMIALVLIMVFIIFGIFLFRKVGIPSSIYIGETDKISNVKADTTKTSLIFIANTNNDGSKGYHVYAREAINEEGKRLAQQLITTVGTLVVAIASFYFGTTAMSSAAQKERDTIIAAQTSNPVIDDITPKEGEKGKVIDMEIVGTDFNKARTVQLVRGSEKMICTGVSSNATKIQCKVMIDKEPDGKWDVIVSNDDGKQAKLSEAFTIKRT